MLINTHYTMTYQQGMVDVQCIGGHSVLQVREHDMIALKAGVTPASTLRILAYVSGYVYYMQKFSPTRYFVNEVEGC